MKNSTKKKTISDWMNELEANGELVFHPTKFRFIVTILVFLSFSCFVLAIALTGESDLVGLGATVFLLGCFAFIIFVNAYMLLPPTGLLTLTKENVTIINYPGKVRTFNWTEIHGFVLKGIALFDRIIIYFSPKKEDARMFSMYAYKEISITDLEELLNSCVLKYT